MITIHYIVYNKMLKKIWELFVSENMLYLPKFYELFIKPIIQNFYVPEGDKVDCSKDYTKIVEQFANLYGSKIALAEELKTLDYMPLKKLCLEYDLNDNAEILRKNCLPGAHFFIGLYESHLKK